MLFVDEGVGELEIVYFVQAALKTSGSRYEQRGVRSRRADSERLAFVHSEISSRTDRYVEHHAGRGAFDPDRRGDSGVLVPGSGRIHPPFSRREGYRRHVDLRLVIHAVPVARVHRVDRIRAREHRFLYGIRAPSSVHAVLETFRRTVRTIDDHSVRGRSNGVPLGFRHARYEHSLRRARNVQNRRRVRRSRSDAYASGGNSYRAG